MEVSEKVNAVQRMQDYIGVHADEEITMGQLSEVSLYSPWYSYRIFKGLLGLTPSDYIRRLRLSRSAMKLKNEKQKISDLAFEMGFGSVDGYQRAFNREFGVNPYEYAKKPIPIPLFIPYGVKFKSLWKKEKQNMENVKNVFISVIEKEERKVIIKRGLKADEYWDYCQEVGCDVWGKLMSMKSLCNEPVCLWLPEKYIKPNTSKYVQGVEVQTDYKGEIPEGFDVITLPKATYLMFNGEPFDEENYCEAIQAVQDSMKKYNPQAMGFCWDDENPRIQLEPVGDRGYIELRAVKRLK